jgi:hypothetical protein
MTPQQHEELKRQVQELLDKGFVRESISFFCCSGSIGAKEG